MVPGVKLGLSPRSRRVRLHLRYMDRVYETIADARGSQCEKRDSYRQKNRLIFSKRSEPKPKTCLSPKRYFGARFVPQLCPRGGKSSTYPEGMNRNAH